MTEATSLSRSFAMSRIITALTVALAVAVPAFAQPEPPIDAKVLEAYHKKLDEMKLPKEMPGSRLIGASEEFMGKAFPKHSFVILRFMQYPLARQTPPGLASNNIFVVKPDKSVALIKDRKELEKFFQDAAAAAKNELEAKVVTQAWLRLSQELHQDSMFRFSIPEGKLTTTVDAGKIQASGQAVLDPKGGDKGQLTATIQFDDKGKLAKVTEDAKLQAGIRPICHATKLLDPDPIVRQMASDAIRLMGREVKPYLDEQRKGASPELQREIDRLWQRIVEEGR
jgi:hypothetical protein